MGQDCQKRSPRKSQKNVEQIKITVKKGPQRISLCPSLTVIRLDNPYLRLRHKLKRAVDFHK